MKKILFILLLLTGTLAFGQAKKPTLMVVPSDNYCFNKGYIIEIEQGGQTRKLPDYRRALLEDTELLLVTNKINTMMADRGFPAKDMSAALKRLERDNAENQIQNSNGQYLEETGLDQLKRVAKADIVLQLTWKLNTVGPKKSVTFSLQGLDAYTDKQVAGAQGTGAPSYAAELDILLEEAVLAHIDNFNARLMEHFNDLFANGREVRVEVMKWSNFSGDFYTEYQGEELAYIIEDWFAENTVKGRFSTQDATASQLSFEQVRIPLYDERNRATDTRRWLRGLQKFLKSEYGIESSISVRGLGQATLILGKR